MYPDLKCPPYIPLSYLHTLTSTSLHLQHTLTTVTTQPHTSQKSTHSQPSPTYTIPTYPQIHSNTLLAKAHPHRSPHTSTQGQHTLILHSSYPREIVGSSEQEPHLLYVLTVCQSHSFTSNSVNMGRASEAPHLLQPMGSSNMEPITLPPSSHSLTHICRATLIQCWHDNNSQHYFH